MWQALLLLLVAILIVGLCGWHWTLLKKNDEHIASLKTIVHEQTLRALQATSHSDPIVALLTVSEARAALRATADVVGGVDILSEKVGIDVADHIVTLNEHEHAIRKTLQ
jgi:hypothetical protein